MGKPRQPIELIELKGRKHLTKKEIEERKAREVKPITDDIIAPDYLTKKQKEEFYKISSQLEKLGIMGETDVDALGRYITANQLYITAVKKLRSREVLDDPFLLDRWSKLQERYFKQARASANDLGLSITSRCKIVVPEIKKDEKPTNKFSKFEKVSNASTG